MLRTNSKKAVENIRAYIFKYFDGTNYDLTAANFEEAAKHIYNTFKAEKGYEIKRIGENAAFTDWTQGLPSIIDTCYWYNREAIDDLGIILEETEEEKAKYTEEKAEILLTALIFREIRKAVLYK